MATLKSIGTSAMIRFALICGLLGVSLAGQELIITHAPQYVTFQQQDKHLQTSQVPKLVAHTLGLQTDSKDLGWQGLVQGSMFKRPKANVLVTIVTHPEQALPVKKLAKFPVNDDVVFPDIEGVMDSLQGMFLDQTPLMLDLHADSNMFDLHTEEQLFKKLPNSVRKLSDRLLDSDSILRTLTSGSLNMSASPDLSLMTELQMIDDVIKTLSGNKKLMERKMPDLFSFTIHGLRTVADKHGPTAQKTQDATKMVTDFVHHVTDNFKNLYKDNVVVEVLQTAPQKGNVRKVRSLMQEAVDPTPIAGPSTTDSLNLASDYDENYPAIFNIVLWLMVVLGVATYAIAYGMWFMDPGRDSIIYRMTSQRLKKE